MKQKKEKKVHTITPACALSRSRYSLAHARARSLYGIHRRLHTFMSSMYAIDVCPRCMLSLWHTSRTYMYVILTYPSDIYITCNRTKLDTARLLSLSCALSLSSLSLSLSLSVSVSLARSLHISHTHTHTPTHTPTHTLLQARPGAIQPLVAPQTPQHVFYFGCVDSACASEA